MDINRKGRKGKKVITQNLGEKYLATDEHRRDI